MHHLQKPIHINYPQTEKTRVFICITKQHSARKLAPFTILQKLHSYLPRETQISEVQIVPTGFALISKDAKATQQILQYQNTIHETIKDSTIELEEKWITVIISELPTTTQSFEEDNLLITEEIAKNELQLLIGVQLEKVC